MLASGGAAKRWFVIKGAKNREAAEQLIRYMHSADIQKEMFKISNGYVYPASHRAGNTAWALPMGARLRLKASRSLSGFTPEAQKIFRAMQRYGLIVADNGSDMYVSGTYDNRWNNGVLNPAFSAIKASDFEVVKLGYQPPPPPTPPTGLRIVP